MICWGWPYITQFLLLSRAPIQKYIQNQTKSHLQEGWGEGVGNTEDVSEVETIVGSLLSRDVEDSTVDSAVLLADTITGGDDVRDSTI